MRSLTKLRPEELRKFLNGVTISPTVKGENITVLELRQGGKILHIAQDGSYSPTIACHSVEEGVYKELHALATPNGELLFDDEDAAEESRRALNLDAEKHPIQKRRVQQD
jgi:hypothetical protein